MPSPSVAINLSPICDANKVYLGGYSSSDDSALLAFPCIVAECTDTWIRCVTTPSVGHALRPIGRQASRAYVVQMCLALQWL